MRDAVDGLLDDDIGGGRVRHDRTVFEGKAGAAIQSFLARLLPRTRAESGSEVSPADARKAARSRVAPAWLIDRYVAATFARLFVLVLASVLVLYVLIEYLDISTHIARVRPPASAILGFFQAKLAPILVETGGRVVVVDGARPAPSFGTLIAAQARGADSGAGAVYTYARGRPKKDQPKQVTQTRYRVKAHVKQNASTLERMTVEAGCFVLLTNVAKQGEGAADAREILSLDKEQHGVEQNFAFLKDPAVVNAIFAATGKRVRTLPI